LVSVDGEFTDVSLLTEIVATQQAISTSDLDLDAVMSEVVTQARRLTGADGAVVEMVEGEDVVYRAVAGAAEPHLGLRLKTVSSLSGVSVRSGDILVCDDSELDPRVDLVAARNVGARSMVMVPLRHRDAISGVLKVFSGRPSAFRERELRVLQLMAGSLGAAIVRADLVDRLAATAKQERRKRGSEPRPSRWSKPATP
jgi:GAF domain-containing protein